MSSLLCKCMVVSAFKRSAKLCTAVLLSQLLNLSAASIGRIEIMDMKEVPRVLLGFFK